jgi:hypothetical protein
MSYYNLHENHDGYGQPTTPSIINYHLYKVDFFKGFEDDDVNDPRSTAKSSMRYLSYENDYYSPEYQLNLFIFTLISTVIQITCWVTCPGEVLCVIGVLRIFIAIYFMTIELFGVAGSELFWALIWISVGNNKITNNREQREAAERIPEDVEDPIVLATNANNLPHTVIAAHGINSHLPRDMRNTQQRRNGRGNYHEIIPATIVDMGSSSTANGEISQNNMQDPPAIAVPDRGVGIGLEPSSNRIEEVGFNRNRFNFAAGSVEMANLNALVEVGFNRHRENEIV